MSISDFQRYADDENPKIALARCCFLSTRPNSHKLIIDEETLRRYAPTILGMFLIGNMNWSETDVLSHEKKPLIYGYFPENQEIEFVEKDGYLLAYATAVVSKLYANEYYEIFKKDNFRNTSVEMLVDAEETEYGKFVRSFDICGLTTLGKKINGSCPDANIKITRFSQDEAKVYYASLWDDIKMKGAKEMPKPTEEKDVVMEIEQQEEMVEQTECASENQNEEQTEEMAEQPVTEEKCSEDKEEKEEVAKEEEKCAEDESKEEDDDSKDEEEEQDDSEKEDDDKEAKMQEQIAELMSTIEEQKATIETLSATVDELSEYKLSIEKAQKDSIVTATLAQVKGRMSDEDYAKFEESGANCDYANINIWKNEVLASMATILMSELKKSEDVVKISVDEVENVEKKSGLWD